jgi:hypothetical protein
LFDLGLASLSLDLRKRSATHPQHRNNSYVGLKTMRLTSILWAPKKRLNMNALTARVKELSGLSESHWKLFQVRPPLLSQTQTI